MIARYIVSALLLFMTGAVIAEEDTDTGTEVGQRPPDYLGREHGGDKLYVTDSEGQILIATFWATWCAPCLKELPVLNAIQNKAGSNRVRVVAINLKEPRKQFRKALKAFRDYEITFVHDERGSIARRFNVKGVPNMFIIDVDGRIAFHHVGYSDSALKKIVGDINSLLVKNQLQ